MNTNNNKLRIHITIYSSTLNSDMIMLKSKKSSIIKNIPSQRKNVYLSKLKNTKKVIRVKIVNIYGRRIEIDKEVYKSGWLVFPRHRYAAGVVLFGKFGIVSAPSLPSTSALFVPLDLPIIHLLDVVVDDFY
ncbi:hypothetical protein Pcal_0565 [Pyrobaculum calidifontis JCM 11548]|uniref:Uncharacterized protein n=1 Tax=Pyrobaculum calidifontis (strain DSM 21063 / JCM 11548 / VA1) TaxID=410359 RepID=A3MTM5_PYRCJ|nr:hypothetical protein Pcal_0565 [Pyrobaculum calidifontis JCM 11548]